MEGDDQAPGPTTFEDFRKYFYYGPHAQLWEVLDTRNLAPVQEAVHAAQAQAYGAGRHPGRGGLALHTGDRRPPVPTAGPYLRLWVFRSGEDRWGGRADPAGVAAADQGLPTRHGHLSPVPKGTRDHGRGAGLRRGVRGVVGVPPWPAARHTAPAAVRRPDRGGRRQRSHAARRGAPGAPRSAVRAGRTGSGPERGAAARTPRPSTNSPLSCSSARAPTRCSSPLTVPHAPVAGRLEGAVGLARPGARIAVVDMAVSTGPARVLEPLARLACRLGGADIAAHPWVQAGGGVRRRHAPEHPGRPHPGLGRDVARRSARGSG